MLQKRRIKEYKMKGVTYYKKVQINSFNYICHAVDILCNLHTNKYHPTANRVTK